MTLHHRYVGCDVAKAQLDLFDPAEPGARAIPNTPEACAELARRLAASGAFVVFEATGAHDRALRQALADAGAPFARLNPTLVRRYAQARGRRAKTDAIDAVVLADLGARLTPPADPVPDPARERLAQLAARRDQLVGMRAMEKTRLIDADDRVIRADLEDAIARLGEAVGKIEAEIARHIRAVPALADDAQLIATAPGIGPVAAMTLLALMPELGHIGPKPVAALAGLAPYNHDSGLFQGQRRIAGGRGRVRRALYMAALAARRVCPDLAAFYERVAVRSASKKVALIAVARKLLVRLNAMLRDRRAYAP